MRIPAVVAAVALLAIGAGILSADVLILKDGTKVAGTVLDKKTHYEVTTEAGLRTFLKDEVEKVSKDPKEFLGDSEKLFDEAKKEYLEAVELTDLNAQSTKMRAALEKLTKARAGYAETRELFPEDKHEFLDKTLVNIMQLMRLLRERVGSEIAKGGAPPPPAPLPLPPPPATGTAPVPPPVIVKPAPPPPVVSSLASLDTAFATLLDPGKRSEPAARKEAREAFQGRRGEGVGSYDLSTAAMLFLSRSDADWKIEGAALKALQDYLSKPFMKEPAKMTPAQHLEAANHLAGAAAEIKKAGSAPAAEALTLFAFGHLGGAPEGADSQKVAQALGLTVSEKQVGTPEGLGLRDMNNWISSGDYDLAVLAFIKQYRAIETPALRYVWSWALLRLADQKKRGYDRAVNGLAGVKAMEAPLRDHVTALSTSITKVAPCKSCGGEGKFRCTNCHGKKDIKTLCEKCEGKGQIYDGFYFTGCNACKKSGYSKILRCTKCQTGTFDCTKCEKPRKAPDFSSICGGVACPSCEGRGTAFRKVAVACKSCLGAGLKLVPASDPSKVLP
jgi:hypothetical protein